VTALARAHRALTPPVLAGSAILLTVALSVWGVPILELIELKTYDLRFLSRGPLEPGPAVVLALIDEKSLDAEGRWPWPRSKVAALVERLSRDGARVIGFDIGFPEPDENTQLHLLDQLRDQLGSLGVRDGRMAAFLRAAREQADNDRILAEALRTASADVVLGYFFHMAHDDVQFRLGPEAIAERLRQLGPSRYPLVAYRDRPAGPIPLIRAYAPETNIEVLTASADASGFFSVVSDPDGVVRWMPLAIQGGEDAFPPLAVLTAWHYLGRPPLTLKVSRHGVDGVQMGARLVPTDGSGRLLVNYLGPARTFPHFSITDILRGTVPPGTFKDRIVLVGASAIAAHDVRTTPVGPVYPGVEIHATVVDNIVTRRFLTRPDWARVVDLLAIVALGAVLGVALPRVSPAKGILLASGLFVLHVLVARWLFVHAAVWLGIVYPVLGLWSTYTVLTMHYYVTEQRERKRISQTFRQYVAPIVVEEMLRRPEPPKLGGEERVLTVLFSDLEGFTTYSERYAPSEMIQILSSYYDRMTEQIFFHRGMLNEYVGDELLAVFGAPLELPDHAHRACAAALAMRQERRALHAEWAKIGRPFLRARTGINSGLMLVGNLGSSYRFAYGVLGDQVNLGSRLEGLNKLYGTEILLGENTARLVEGAFRLREVDVVRAKGKSQAVRIYELLAHAGAELPEPLERALPCYADGLGAYRQQRWDEGLRRFEETLASWPADGPARTMAERCRLYRQAPPPEGWDGIFDQLQKPED
jgi:adenylate cyclase